MNFNWKKENMLILANELWFMKEQIFCKIDLKQNINI